MWTSGLDITFRNGLTNAIYRDNITSALPLHICRLHSQGLLQPSWLRRCWESIHEQLSIRTVRSSSESPLSGVYPLHLLGVTHISCSKTTDFSHSHTEIGCSVVHSSATSTCQHNEPVPIATYHQFHFHITASFTSSFFLFVFFPFLIFFPLTNKGLLLCGYRIILQLFALRIFLPPTFSQLHFTFTPFS